MNEVYEFTRVNRLLEAPGDHLLAFVTDVGHKVLIRDENAGALDAEFARRAVAKHKTVFVCVDESGGCNFMASIIEDWVQALQPPDDERDEIAVALSMRPSRMRLKRQHRHFAELRLLLERALSSGEKVWVGAFPGDPVILDVVAAPK